ncbi:F-box domain-containing protein [Mycena sanguinolenta]|uniref:F-box domain-containing protein n=1 Tax=Mycena sanguinolenta TaxID=230812 RepID=A0A8H6YEF5_9AGAR|nr:F-box domain-containing protein [Mycena sanguinolenta]
MTLTGASVRAAVLEQTERTKHLSKADIERIIEESELNITSLDSQIDILIKLRDSQRADVLALRYIMSSIRTLPVELLAKVFDLSIEDPTHIKDVYRLAQVCSDWRQVAHSTPQLWSRPLRVDLRKRADADGLKAWLAQSAPLSLPISIIPAHKDIAGTLEELLSVASRWHSLRIYLTTYAMPSWFFRKLSQGMLDSLEVLELGPIDDDADPTPLSFTAVPRLRKLNILCGLTAPQTLVPWVQLTDLVIQIDSHEAVAILAQCTNLVRASINTSPWCQPPAAKRDIVALGQLQTLRFFFRDDHMRQTGHHGPPFFDYLSAPLLQALRLDFDREYWTSARLTAFQLRAPNITQLEFASRKFSSEDLVTAIRNASSLTHLTLTFCTKAFDDAFIRTLHYQPGMIPLLPQLHNLVVKSEVMSFTQDVLAGMIMSRWWPASSEAPPAVTSWTHVELEFGRRCATLNSARFADMLKDIPSDVLIVSRNDRI